MVGVGLENERELLEFNGAVRKLSQQVVIRFAAFSDAAERLMRRTVRSHLSDFHACELVDASYVRAGLMVPPLTARRH